MPAPIALALAEQKALAVSRRNPGDMVLGGDSVLALEGELISKSPDLAALRALLRRLSGKTPSADFRGRAGAGWRW